MPAPSRAEAIAECTRLVACPACGVRAGKDCKWRLKLVGVSTEPYHVKREIKGMKLFHEQYGRPL